MQTIDNLLSLLIAHIIISIMILTNVCAVCMYVFCIITIAFRFIVMSKPQFFLSLIFIPTNCMALIATSVLIYIIFNRIGLHGIIDVHLDVQLLLLLLLCSLTISTVFQESSKKIVNLVSLIS